MCCKRMTHCAGFPQALGAEAGGGIHSLAEQCADACTCYSCRPRGHWHEHVDRGVWLVCDLIHMPSREVANITSALSCGFYLLAGHAQVAASLALWRIFSKDQAFITAMTAVERRIRDGHLSLAVSTVQPRLSMPGLC